MAFRAHKEDLTLDQIEKELLQITDVENQKGFLYFFLNYIYVEDSVKGHSFMGDDSFDWQRKAAVVFLKSRYMISKKMRQVGFSTTVGSYCLWRALFFPTQIINVVSLKLKDSTTFLRRIKFSYDRLPRWMKQKKIEDQKTSIKFEHNNSQITSLPLTDDPARGETLSLLVLDEFAKMRNSKDVLAAGVPALATGALANFSNTQLPSQLFIISTYPENPQGNEYVRLLNTAREGKDDEYSVIEVDPFDIPHYQSERWHKQQLDLLGPKRYAVEIRGIEPIDNENTFLPDYVLHKLEHQNPMRCDFLNADDVDEEGYYKDLNILSMMNELYDERYNYMRDLWIWEDPIPGHQYALTTDVAGGKSGDHSAFIVMDLEMMTQVAEYKSNRIDTERFKQVVHKVGEYYNHSKISVENNGMGLGICDFFEKTLQYDQFYMHRKSKHVYISGFPVNTKTRGEMLMYMHTILHNGEITIRSLRLINELKNFGYNSAGRLCALGDANDDLVFALAQFCYLMTIGWAVSDAKMIAQLPWGPLGMADDKKEEEREIEIAKNPFKRTLRKYWDEDFDLYLTDEQKEIVDMISATGSTVSIDDLKRLMNEPKVI